MQRRSIRRCLPITVLALAACMLAPDRATAQDAQKKPPLSEALRKALAKERPADVQERFIAAIETGKLDYEIDPQQLNALGLEYIQAGDIERGQAVMAVAANASRLLLADMMPPGMAEAMEEAATADKADRERKREQQAAARQSEEEAAAERARARTGPPRDDLDRFHGIYGTEEGGITRALFLVKNCDGHLLFSSTWGDAAPWVLRSTSDTSFEYPGDDFMKPIHIEITTGDDGRATRIAHDLDALGSPLDRIADLPPDWQPKCGGGRS
jgi:hypothetical protein